MGVGRKLANDGRYHIYLHGVATPRQLDECGIDRIINLDGIDHIVRELIELGLLEVVEIYHIAVDPHIITHRTTLLLIPALSIATTYYACNRGNNHNG